jgi:uncharacterized protein (TIGR02284 family)
MQEYQSAIFPLNDLLVRNMDLLTLFEKVVEDIDHPSLRDWIEEMMKNHQNFADELAFEVQKIGGSPTEKTSMLGDIQRFWITFKKNILNRDNEKVLEDCEHMESQIFNAYDKVLNKVTMPLSTTNALRRHYEIIQKSIVKLDMELHA